MKWTAKAYRPKGRPVSKRGSNSRPQLPPRIREAMERIIEAHKSGAPEPEAEMLTYFRWSQPEYFAWLNANRDALWNSSTPLKSEEDESDEQ